MNTVLKKYYQDALLEQIALYEKNTIVNKEIAMPNDGKGGGDTGM